MTGKNKNHRPTWTYQNVSGYDFTQLVKSNPPPKDYDTPVVPFGRFTGHGAWVM